MRARKQQNPPSRQVYLEESHQPGLMSSLATGAALGAGSAVGHEAIRGIFGSSARRDAVDYSQQSGCDSYIASLETCLERARYKKKDPAEELACRNELQSLENAIAGGCFGM